MEKNCVANGKIAIPSEPAYLLAVIMLAFAVAMSAASGFCVSMVVAPAYVLHLKFDFLSVGVWEYIVQGLLFAVICVILRKFKIAYLVSFLNCLLYGLFIDIFRMVIPFLDPSNPVTQIVPRILLFTGGMLFCYFSIALFFRIYLPPQVYDFFPKALSIKFGYSMTKCKLIYDACSLITALALTVVFFFAIRGIGIGTVVLTLVNGPLIGLLGKVLDRFFIFKPLFPKAAEKLGI